MSDGDGSIDGNITDAAMNFDTSGVSSDLFSNIGSSAFDSSGGTSLSDLASSMFGGVFGGGNSPASVGNANQNLNSIINPDTVANQTVTGDGGQNAPTMQGQGQGQQGQGQGQGQNANQYAPQSAVDQLKKALTGLKQQQRQNPWQIGGPNFGQNANQLNRAGRIPTGQVPPMPAQGSPNLFDDSQGSQEADVPSANAQNVDFMNDNNPPPPSNGIDPAAATRAGLRTNAPDTGFRIPGAPANSNNPPPPTAANAGGAVPPGGGGGGPSAPVAGVGGPSLGSLAGLSRLLGLGLTTGDPLVDATGAAIVGSTTPAQAPGAPTNAWFQRPSGVGGFPTGTDPNQPPADPNQPSRPVTPTPTQIARGAGGRNDPSIDPRNKQPFEKEADPPTKKDGTPDKRYAGPDHPITRDARGMQSVPTMLQDLARFALPLMMGLGGMMGGRGRRGFGGMRGGFGGRGRGAHFGGGGPFGGHWPYHHPEHGWDMHGNHPGGGWRPMSPGHMREFLGNRFGGGAQAYAGDGGDGGGSTGNPQIDQLLQSLGLGGGGGNRNQVGFGNQQGGGNQGGGGRPGGNWSAPAIQGPWSSNPFLQNIVGSESGGRNVSVIDSDGQWARGIYQFHDATWRQQASKLGIDINRFPRADMAPPEVQQQVALATPFNQWGRRTRDNAHAAYGQFDDNLTMGQLADQFGGQAWAQAKGKTNTGGSAGPNPDGNPTQVGTAGGLPVMSSNQ